MQVTGQDSPRWERRSLSTGRGCGPSANSISPERENQPLLNRRGFPEFSELVLACRHHLKLVVCAGTVISSVLVALAWFFTDAHYSAESLVRVRQHQDVVFTTQTSRSDDAIFVRSQEQLVQSPTVLATALNDQQLLGFRQLIPATEATAWLKDLLQVDVSSGAEVMSIAAAHPNPHLAQALANAVTNAYLGEVSRRAGTDRALRQAELEKAARQADGQLDELWEELNSVAGEVGSDDSQSLTMRDEMQLQSYRDFAQQMRVAQLRASELQSRLLEQQQLMATETDAADELSLKLLQEHPEVLANHNRLSQLDQQLRQMREVAANDDSPRIRRLQEDRERVLAESAKLVSDLQPQLREQIQLQNKTRLESSLKQLQQQIEQNQTEKEFLRARMAEIDSTVVRTEKRNGIQLEMARHAVDRQTRLADGLWQSLEELKIEFQSQPRVALLELARLPTEANHGRQIKTVAAAAAVGWLAVILGIGYREWRGCTVRNSDDVVSHCLSPVYGQSCLAGAGIGDPSRVNHGSNELAARLLLWGQTNNQLPSVLVSSTAAAEPRHLVALELAKSLTVQRRRTLLIDVDNAGVLTRVLGADALPGLLQATVYSDPQQFIVPSSVDNLDFLPLGQRLGHDCWIDPEAFRQVLTRLRASYAAIIVNGPAMSSPIENLFLASQLDQMVFAAFEGVSRWNQLAASEQVAMRSGTEILGFVMHSGKSAVSLALRCDLQGASSHLTANEDATEISLQDNLSAIQLELQRAANHPSAKLKASVVSEEFTT